MCSNTNRYNAIPKLLLKESFIKTTLAKENFRHVWVKYYLLGYTISYQISLIANLFHF